ncbi:MAG TPA: biotin carboxylase N-terminal domain-containing protein [Vicinamibacterales bacterium]|nr:biotin carboxylase N-terminal domain-containing protein [Vicinamibacterales bacterium]
MFKRLLIANRGEIAVRVIRACREMGIESVAVYSDADRMSLHTTLADRAVRIGPSSAAESYLSISAIIDAARSSGAQAVHPGYGFLSENQDLASACVDAGLAFIGPPADVISTMGSKIVARRIAREAGAPVVPGETPVDQSDQAIAAAATAIGFPVLIKPSEGGGGIGMKEGHAAATLSAAIAQARREAIAAFGDGTLYVERLIAAPRHVEFQVLADHHGQVLHVFERECSIQRRHQKVIEETPSTVMTPQLRARMGAAAVAVARAAGYRNAGTVEFLLEGTGDSARYYFLEMNTRLQVEHPVTEQVAGLDLVRAQIRIASGEPLPWTQDALTQRGHAIEARVYAEDPISHLPQAGPLLLYREPSMPGVRIDSGVAEGSKITVHYDPLLAKLVAWGETREIARRRALAALRAFPILGIKTNIPMLVELLQHPRFVDGALDTRFLDVEGASLAARLSTGPTPDVLAVAAAARATTATPAAGGASRDIDHSSLDPWTSLRGVRV